MHRAKFIGREFECVTLHTPPHLAMQNRTTALTDNFLPTEIEGSFEANQLLSVRISGMNADGTLLAHLPLERNSSPHARSTVAI